LGFPSFALFARLLVFVFPVVQKSAHRRLSRRADFHEVKIRVPGEFESAGERQDSQLLAIRADQSHLARPDLVIYP
jgi:hypothetical protein